MTRVLARKRDMVDGLIAMHLDNYKPTRRAARLAKTQIAHEATLFLSRRFRSCARSTRFAHDSPLEQRRFETLRPTLNASVLRGATWVPRTAPGFGVAPLSS
jgi:hypothetical protein